MSAAQVVTLVAATLLGWALTEAVRRDLLRRRVLDVPNERSMHVNPTPRGGGLAIVIVVQLGVWLGWTAHWIADGPAMALLGGGSLVAVIGWWDDHHATGAGARAVGHFCAAIWSVWCLGGLPSVTLGAATIPMGWLGSLVAVLAVVWMLNLYNFMDGIDGIAATEAGVAAGIASILLTGVGEHGLAFVAGLIGAAAFGFLPWNWAPSRIFLGDVGSGFLGFAFGVLLIASERSQPGFAFVVLLLLAVFVADATTTLGRRMARGERWYDAHRMHAYQRAVQSGWSHDRVTLAVAGLTVGLGVLACWVTREPQHVLAASVIAVAALVAVYGLIERRAPMR